MTRPYNEKRNKKIVVLVERRRIPLKQVPAQLVALGFGLITYAAVRKIISRYRNCHNLSHQTARL